MENENPQSATNTNYVDGRYGGGLLDLLSLEVGTYTLFHLPAGCGTVKEN